MKETCKSVTLADVQPTKRYSFVMFNPKNRPQDAAFNGWGKDILDPNGGFQEMMSRGWTITEITEEELELYPETQEALHNVIQCYDNLLDALETAERLVNAERDEYLQEHEYAPYVSLTFKLRISEITRFRDLFYYDARIIR